MKSTIKFIESLRIENGEFSHLPLHQRRLDLTLCAHFGASARIDLARELSRRSLPASGLYKIRVTYERTITGIDVDAYSRREIPGIAFVEANGLDYRYKYADRSGLDALRARVSSGVQPVIIQNGLVTDALYANLCFFDPALNLWLTPEKPLLAGTARAAALAAGEISVAEIYPRDIAAGKYSQMKLINCMTLFGEAAAIPMHVF